MSVRRLVPVALLVASAAALAAPVISWDEAADHVGRLVTVEGHVAQAHTDERACVLRFDADDAGALRVLLLVPLVTRLPPAPHRLYEGRRIRATGRITRFAGRLEMVLQDPDQIEVLGLTPGDEAAPPPAPDRAPVLPPAQPPPAELDCARAREAWQQARTEARAAVAELDACLATGEARCAPVGDRLGPALTRLEWAEQRLQARCAPAGDQ